MGDLVGFRESLNASAPFLWDEYDTVWKSDRRYHDFQPGNSVKTSCQYPTMYGEDGLFLGNITDDFHQCRDSEFDQVRSLRNAREKPIDVL
jgi:alpha-1,3-glucan synthase